MKKFNLLFIIGLLALTACGPGNSGDGDPNGSQDPDNGGSHKMVMVVKLPKSMIPPSLA